MFTALAAELSGPAAAGLTACELEDLLDERGREVIRQLLQDHYDLRTAREEQQAREQHAPATGPDGITRTRLETGHGRLLATLFGTVRVTRCAWRKRLGKMRTRLASGEKPNRKRMDALVTVYDAEPAKRRPHDVIAPPGGRHGDRRLRPGPKALAKWLAGSVRKDPAEVIATAFGEAEARDPGHLRTWVVLAGGAEHQLDLIRAEAGRREAEIHIVIDLIHVLEYIWKAAWNLHDAGDPAAEDWVAVKALAVLAGDSARASEKITAEASAASLPASRRTGADSCVRYLNARHEYLRYDQALAEGWPIATGVIEGACRHLIADRLDIGGARWGLDGAEAVLTLRAVISNSDFDEYWSYHLAREHQRLYPGTKQGKYALGA